MLTYLQYCSALVKLLQASMILRLSIMLSSWVSWGSCMLVVFQMPQAVPQASLAGRLPKKAPQKLAGRLQSKQPYVAPQASTSTLQLVSFGGIPYIIVICLSRSPQIGTTVKPRSWSWLIRNVAQVYLAVVSVLTKTYIVTGLPLQYHFPFMYWKPWAVNVLYMVLLAQDGLQVTFANWAVTFDVVSISYSPPQAVRVGMPQPLSMLWTKYSLSSMQLIANLTLWQQNGFIITWPVGLITYFTGFRRTSQQVEGISQATLPGGGAPTFAGGMAQLQKAMRPALKSCMPAESEPAQPFSITVLTGCMACSARAERGARTISDTAITKAPTRRALSRESMRTTLLWEGVTGV